MFATAVILVASVAVSALPETPPVKLPTKPEFAVMLVPVIAAAALPPIVVPSIAPPSMLTLLASCVAIVPVPADTLASALASV